VTISSRVWWWIALAVVTVALAVDPWAKWNPVSVDFRTYLAAAQVGLQNGWPLIYDQVLVAARQSRIEVNDIWSQPFISPPVVAWLVAPLTVFPFWVGFGIWAVFNFVALGLAMAWAGVSTGISRWIAVIAALAPWWVAQAITVGQVVPLVAAGMVVAWRLLREEKDIAAGFALSLIFLKPNTAILVPVALLVAGRYRAFVAWLAAGGVIAVIAVSTLGGNGMLAYMNLLLGPLPPGADALTLHGAAGLTGSAGTMVRVLIVGIVLATAFKLRPSPGLVLPVAIVGSLIMSPYLHGSDLCLLAVAAWMIWEERTAPAWRVPLALGWVLASPFLLFVHLSPSLNRWPWVEYALLLALVVAAWRPSALTPTADLRTRATA
jgi:hypothetical protein